MTWRGQPVLGDAHVHHAARYGQVFEDDRLVAPAGQEVGGGKPGRTGADDGHLVGLGRWGGRGRDSFGGRRVQRGQAEGTLARLCGDQLADFVRSPGDESRAACGGHCLRIGPVGRHRHATGDAAVVGQALGPVGAPALDVVDGDGMPGGRQCAVGLAGVRTGAPDDGRQRVVALDDRGSQVRVFLETLEDVGGDVESGGTGGTAGRRHPAVGGERRAGGAGGVLGEMALGQIEQREDGVADGVGDAAPGGVVDILHQAADPLQGVFVALALGEQVELLAQDVDAYAAGTAAAARFFLDEGQIAPGQFHRADVALEHHAPPRHHGRDVGHIGLLQTGEHLFGLRSLISIGKDRDRSAVHCQFWRLRRAHQKPPCQGVLAALRGATRSPAPGNPMIAHRLTLRRVGRTDDLPVTFGTSWTLGPPDPSRLRFVAV